MELWLPAGTDRRAGHQEEKHFPMAKKTTQSKRVPRAAEPRMYGDGKPSQQAATSTTPAPATRSAQPATRQAGMTRTAVQSTDYSYVRRDLRRLGITAAAMFALLIALGLIIK
jgi:lysozyme family protein